MADVTFDHVAKRYGDVSVIDDLNLHIRDHELMVLVGPSGCGKSTALRMIAGLEEISAGKIAIGGRVVNGLAPKERDIAMVFQSYALYPHMTVRDNLGFGLKMRGTPRADIAKRVDNAADILGIKHLLERKPRELSGGQRQRVAVGRAIVRDPAVFLFDEPLSNLDAKLRVQTRAEITRLQQTLGTTSVYVTHDQVEAMTMGHRITVLRDGKIQQVGTPQEVYEQPANVFVAQFIGTPPMNLMPATIADGVLRTAAFSIPARWPDGKVIVGVRPEHISRGAMFDATVDVVEPIGHESIVYATVAGERLVAIFDPHETPRAGETIGLAIDAQKAHVFDAATEMSS
ncbi:MAG TPA: sn-glycerol-3-phosphate ABC transporter ATP-binding protein UgpC [Thermoanaerobaculia bacterium]|nr:sn-glycerol-3-phosphate ABC transporter ATP-binding protein UgpC [Thermoanaerobaculia bacterium]